MIKTKATLNKTVGLDALKNGAIGKVNLDGAVDIEKHKGNTTTKEEAKKNITNAEDATDFASAVIEQAEKKKRKKSRLPLKPILDRVFMQEGRKLNFPPQKPALQ